MSRKKSRGVAKSSIRVPVRLGDLDRVIKAKSLADLVEETLKLMAGTKEGAKVERLLEGVDNDSALEGNTWTDDTLAANIIKGFSTERKLHKDLCEAKVNDIAIAMRVAIKRSGNGRQQRKDDFMTKNRAA